MIVGHLLGNLLVFRGSSELNRYSSLLHASSELLWSVRAILIASVLAHVWAAWSLTRTARAARPIAYTKKVPQAATWASRTMRWGGLFIAVFVVVHLLHLTTGTTSPGAVQRDRRLPWATRLQPSSATAMFIGCPSSFAFFSAATMMRRAS